MLKYTDSENSASLLADHYSEIIGNREFIDFMQAKSEIANSQKAELIIQCFWQMVDLGIDDHHKGNIVSGVSDIEFWMHKLFNKVSGYMLKNGYESEWKKLSDNIIKNHDICVHADCHGKFLIISMAVRQ